MRTKWFNGNYAEEIGDPSCRDRRLELKAKSYLYGVEERLRARQKELQYPCSIFVESHCAITVLMFLLLTGLWPAAGQEESQESTSPDPCARRAITISAVQLTEPGDPKSVPQYCKLDLLVSITDASATNFYDPDPASDRGGLDLSATFIAPSGQEWSVFGFYDGSQWRILFTPTETGDWTYIVQAQDSSGKTKFTPGAFSCVPSTHPGFAQIDGRYLRFSNGEVFFGVGHNTGWQEDVDRPSFSEMAAQKENLLTFWISTPWKLTGPETEPDYGPKRAPIENARDGLGNYNQAACQYLDQVIADAEANNIYLLPAIWTHGQLRDPAHPWSGPGKGDNNWWYNNAYSSLADGSLAPSQFFTTKNGRTDTEQWRLQKNFYRYLIARWGYSRAIIGWVGLVEVDGTNGGLDHPAAVAHWADELTKYFRERDAYRTNHSNQYPMTFSKMNDPAYADTFSLRCLDRYSLPYEDRRIAADIAGDQEVMRASDVPSFHLEFGADVDAARPPPNASQPAFLHNGIWAGFASGAAITPLLWTDRYDFPLLTAAMLEQLKILSEFRDGLDFLGHPSMQFASPTASDAAIQSWGLQMADRGFVWMQNGSGTPLGGQLLTLANVASGEYTVDWFDVWKSGVTPFQSQSALVGSDGLLALTLPPSGQADQVLRFKQVDAGGITRTLAVKQALVRLNVKNPGRDQIKVSGYLPLKAGFQPMGESVSIDFGGLQRNFVLDDRGRTNQGNDRFRLQLKRSKGMIQAGDAIFQLQLNKGTFGSALSDEGLIDADLSGQEVEVTLKITFKGEVLVTGQSSVSLAPLQLSYSAMAGRYGKGVAKH